MSEIKVNKISPRTACGTVTLGDSGDTFTVPSGATITNLGTATGFGGTGVVSWDTASIKTTGFTAVTGTGYFCDTTGGGFTVTLPLSPSAGDVVGVADYAQTWDTANLTLGRNSSNIGGVATDSTISTEGLAVTLVYVDGTKGWIVTDSGLQSEAPGPLFVTATGGTPCSGAIVCTDYKTHTFTGPGTFCVSASGNAAGSNSIDYLVVAGGGGGGGYTGGGGAGGYRESPGTASGSYTVSPRGAAPAVALPVAVAGYPVTVGGGGAGSVANNCKGTNGNNSVFTGTTTITSTGGGAGAGDTAPTRDGNPGGSGGANAYIPANPVLGCIGLGNTPPTNPPQGMNSGNTNSDSATYTTGGGGGGALVVGGNGSAPTAAAGGGGATSSINGTPTARAGGGGGGSDAAKTVGCGGAGGGGKGASPACTTPAPQRNAADNTGGGGGGGVPSGSGVGSGGSGVVIIRYKFQ